MKITFSFLKEPSNVNPVDNEAVSNELEVPVSVEETTLADSESRDKLPAASPEKSFISGTSRNPDALGMENKSALDHRNEHFSESCEEHDV